MARRETQKVFTGTLTLFIMKHKQCFHFFRSSCFETFIWSLPVLSIIMCKLWWWRSTFGDDNLHLAFIGPVIAKLKFIRKWRIFMKFLFTQVLIGMGSLDFSEKKTKNTKNTTNVSWKQSFLNNRWASVCTITLFKWRFNIYDLLKKNYIFIWKN